MFPLKTIKDGEDLVVVSAEEVPSDAWWLFIGVLMLLCGFAGFFLGWFAGLAFLTWG